jgi:phage terminase large subunit-like protein
MTAEPLYATPRTRRPTLGVDAAEVAALLGIELDDWQRLVLDVGLEVDDAGLPAFRDVVVTLPRQQGKSTLVLAYAIHTLLTSQDELVLFGAQQRQDARTRLVEEWWPLLQRSELGGEFTLSRGAGFECLTARSSGSRLRLLSTTEQTSGHGSSPSLVLLDEVWAMREFVSEAIRPATIAKAGSQIVACSTAGTLSSTWWRSQVDAGRIAVATRDPSTAYFEWSVPESADTGDLETWASCMPALGTRIPVAVVEGEFRRLPEHEFRRSFLNQWTGGGEAWSWLSEDDWKASATEAGFSVA